MRGDVGCPVCGSLDFSCGLVTSTTGVDERIEEATTMAELREYRVTVDGYETIMNLSEADAERLGGLLITADEEKKQRSAYPNKVRSARNKANM